MTRRLHRRTRRRLRRLGWAAVLTAAVGLAGAVRAPGSAVGAPPDPKTEDAPKPGSDAAYEAILDKSYDKPEKPEFPEGEAKELSGPVIRLVFDGMVNPGMGEFLISGIERAKKDGAQAVLIEMDTPGGLVSTTRKIAQAIMASEVPVIVYVTPAPGHAASAGTFITLSAHVAAMAPATTIGAAHPVTGGGQDPEAGGKHIGRKVENDLVAMVESIAKERGRNAEWASDAVRYSVAIGAKKALEYGVIEYVAKSRNDLFDQLDGVELMVQDEKVRFATAGAEVVDHELSLREQVLNQLASPGIAMLLGMLGVFGILAEVYHPGLIIPGVLGVLCILLSMIAMEQLPIDFGGIALIVIGIGLMILEIYTPTYGMLGVLGGGGLVIGAMLLVDLEDPEFALDPSFALSFSDVLPLVIVFGGLIFFLGWVISRARKGRVTTGKEGLVGTFGTVLKPVGPEGGMVFVAGEYWKARSESSIPEKADIEVIGLDGLFVQVRPRSAVSESPEQRGPADEADRG